MWSLGISDSILSTCLSGARIDLSAEDNAIALTLAECPSRPYAELIKSDVPGPSSSRSARAAASRPSPPPAIKVSPIEPSAAALRPSPPSIMKVSAIGPSAAALRPSPPSIMKVYAIGPSVAKPTRGELLAQLETLSRKPRSVKRKTLDSVEEDRLALAKVPKLGASSSSPSTHVRKPERVQSPLVKAPTALGSQSHPGSTAEAEGPLGGAVEQPLEVVPITVWNPPTKRVRSPSRRVEKLRRKDPESEIGGDGNSLLVNAELATSAVTSILKDSDLKRSSALPVDEALALSLQGVASVSSHTLSCLIPF